MAVMHFFGNVVVWTNADGFSGMGSLEGELDCGLDEADRLDRAAELRAEYDNWTAEDYAAEWRSEIGLRAGERGLTLWDYVAMGGE